MRFDPRKFGDAVSPELARAISTVMARVRSQVTLRALADALAIGDVDVALSLIPWDRVGVELQGVIEPALRQVAIRAAAGAAGAYLPPRQAGYTSLFASVNEHALKWAAGETGQLIAGLNTESRTAIRTVMERAFREGLHPRESAKLIARQVGLTVRQAAAVARLNATLTVNGLPTVRRERIVARYEKRLHVKRSRVIAHHETMMASNRGQQILWEEGVADGSIAETAEKKWIVTPDDRLCPFCAPMQGLRVPVLGNFESTDVIRRGEPVPRSGGPATTLTPPLHPECLPGDQRIRARNVKATSERQYDGLLIRLSTQSGNIIELTPNHPIATPTGWRAAIEFRPGDEVICSADSRWATNAVSAVSIAEAVRQFEGTLRRSLVSSESYHGDRGGSAAANIRAQPMSMCFPVADVGQLARGLLERPVVGIIRTYARRWFKGTVYNFETESGDYWTEGFRVSNCRCTMGLVVS